MTDIKSIDSSNPSQTQKMKRWFGWIGAILLLLIIPLKAIRWLNIGFGKTIIGIAPSFLGPAGLFFLLLSGTAKLSRRSQVQTLIVTGFIALGLEFAQVLPRPGILAKVKYTFDWLDVVTSLISLVLAYIIAQLIITTNRQKTSL